MPKKQFTVGGLYVSALAFIVALAFVLLACGLCASLHAQNTQPQNSFSAQILAYNPTTYLTFNNPAQLFRENTTGTSFVAWDQQIGYLPVASAQTAPGTVLLVKQPFASAGTLTSLAIQDYTACGSGTRTFVIASGSGTSYTVVSSFTVTAANTAAVQTFTVGAGLPSGITYAAGNLIGEWAATGGCVTGRNAGTSGGPGVYTLTAASALPSGAQTYTFNTPDLDIQAFGAPTSEAILSGQTGFDNKEPNNTAAALPYNTYLYAPNYTLGNVDWSTPFSFMYQIDRLNWGRVGTKVLLSKGATNVNSMPWWKFYITMKTATVAQFCLTVNGAGASAQTVYTACTNAAEDFPNGYNYNIYLTNTATGSPTSFSVTVNGLNSLTTAYTANGSSFGFGGINLAASGGSGYATTTPVHSVGGGTNCTVFAQINATSGALSGSTLVQANNYGCTTVPTMALGPYMASYSGSGTGYATSTSITSTGGGTGCLLTGTMTSSGGVPASITTNATAALSLCTSAPALSFVSPTGTGATLTAITPAGTGGTITPTLAGNSISTATTAPLYINGSWSPSLTTSPWIPSASIAGSTNAAESPLILDEFAAFSGAPSQTLIQGSFYQTKFYQQLLRAIPAKPYIMVFDDDGCADPDNLYALSTAIAAQKLGFLSLQGVVMSSKTGGGDGVAAGMYREMLDQAGLAHIPMAVPSAFAGVAANCNAADITTFNATTSQNVSTYPSAATMYRTVMARYPSTPVFIMLGGGYRGVADWLGSAADGIESLTGAQQATRNATNGGAIYVQGPTANSSFSSDNSLLDYTAGQYVFAHNGTLPIYIYGGQPQIAGPGALSTRNNKDPMFLFATRYGTDTRICYDCLPTQSFLSNLFSGGVNVAVSGGTGYANSTAFTSTGGGASCSVTGYMLASGGVPSGVQLITSSYAGLGYGCFSNGSPPSIVLTAPTGTGVTLTATPTISPCGTVTISSGTSGTTSTGTCTNVYFLPFSYYADPGYTPFMSWFLNSLIDPPPNGAPRGPR